MIEDKDYNVSDNVIRDAFIVFMCVLTLTGCQTPAPEDPAAPEVISTTSNEAISTLLAKAETALANNRLTTPIDDNAYLWYLQVLAIDTQHESANTGISDIVEKYLSWAISNSDTGSAARAFDYLSKAKSVDESHPSIAAVEAYLSSKTTIRTARFPIDRTQLREKNTYIQSKLYEIAEEIDRLEASIVIHAPTDSLGRWIYQKLNSNTGSRISAIFEISNNPQIVLQYE
jgi:hypothetical protein|tara:strand:+ start:184 stop:873 length:690 start_codon:yes stop_codon:yes gene_type:complete